MELVAGRNEYTRIQEYKTTCLYRQVLGWQNSDHRRTVFIIEYFITANVIMSPRLGRLGWMRISGQLAKNRLAYIIHLEKLFVNNVPIFVMANREAKRSGCKNKDLSSQCTRASEWHRWQGGEWNAIGNNIAVRRDDSILYFPSMENVYEWANVKIYVYNPAWRRRLPPASTAPLEEWRVE